MKILMFGYRPPPVFGPSVAYETLMRSEFARQFEVSFINLSVVENIRELERFRPGKLFKLLQFAGTELFHLITCRFDFCCYPVSYNRNAFLKDYALLALARAFGVPTVLFAHGSGVPVFRESLSPRLRRRFDAMVQRAAGVIVIAEALRADYEGLVSTDKLFVVPLGIEPRSMPPRPENSRERFTIVHLGALFGSKGVFDLLEAMPLVLARRPDAKLVIAGDWFRSEEEQKACAFISEQKLDGAVDFAGRVTGEAKWQLLRAGDVFVFPPHSRKEAFGIVLLEAMQAGLPIVATKGGARSEIIADGVNGLLAEEQNPRDLADKILRLAGDPALRERMGRANQEKFAGYYTQEHYGRRMIKVFETLAAQRHA